MKLSELIEKTNSLVLYEKDYNTIVKLASSCSDRLFVRIIDEILKGNLYFSDFEPIFSDEKYSNFLSKNLENQLKINEEISRLVAFRQSITDDTNESSLSQSEIINQIAIEYASPLSKDEEILLKASMDFDLNGGTLNSITANNISDKTKRYLERKYKNDLYEAANSSYRKDTFFHLFDSMKKDNDLVRASKLKIYKALLGSTFNMLSPVSKENTETTLSSQGLSPDDFFLSVKNGIIPINYENQILDDLDYDFLRKNNLTEEEMKQIKSLKIFYKKKQWFSKYDLVSYFKNTYEELSE